MDNESRLELKVGDEVYAKHKNSRYYLGTLKSLADELYYCVLFDDETKSSDLYPDDILVSRLPPAALVDLNRLISIVKSR